MNQKRCTKCSEMKPFSEFGVENAAKDGLKTRCRICRNSQLRDYRKTKEGLISNAYTNQIGSSKKRCHVMPDYSQGQLTEWALKQPVFHALFDTWEKSGYEKELIPSFDRLDDYEPYTLSNIQITTWHENKQKGHDDIRNGINNKQSKAVIGINITTGKTTEHHSIHQAERVLGISIQSISACCLGKQKTTGGFEWKFKID